MNKIVRHSPGYTLIELLVSLVVISIVFGLGVAGYRDFARRQALSGAAKNIASDLKLAQQKAAAGEKPASGTCSAENLSGYYFRVTNATTYTVSAACGSGENVLKTVNLAANPATTNITIAISQPVLFKVLSQGTNLSSASTLTVTDTKSGRQFGVIISIGGSVE